MFRSSMTLQPEVKLRADRAYPAPAMRVSTLLERQSRDRSFKPRPIELLGARHGLLASKSCSGFGRASDGGSTGWGVCDSHSQLLRAFASASVMNSACVNP